MICKTIEVTMVTMATTPVQMSLLYNIDKIEKLMKTINIILNPFGVIATLAALFLLWRSLKNQGEYHNTQILEMREQHSEQVGQVNQQLLQMEANRREKFFRDNIISASENVNSYIENGFERGMYYIIYKLTDSKIEKEVGYACVIYWSISYKSNMKDGNYLIEWRFAIFRTSIPFEVSADDKNRNQYNKMKKEIHNKMKKEIKDKLDELDKWNYVFLLPRFGNEYGQAADGKSSFDPLTLAVNEIDSIEFRAVIRTLSKIQSLDIEEIKSCLDSAKECVDL